MSFVTRVPCDGQPSPYYVYFILDPGSEAVKVGYAQNVFSRMARFQTANAYRLELLGRITCNSEEDARKCEYEFHSGFGCHRLEGEWFSLECDAVKGMVDWFADTTIGPAPELVECSAVRGGVS